MTKNYSKVEWEYFLVQGSSCVLVTCSEIPCHTGDVRIKFYTQPDEHLSYISQASTYKTRHDRISSMDIRVAMAKHSVTHVQVVFPPCVSAVKLADGVITPIDGVLWFNIYGTDLDLAFLNGIWDSQSRIHEGRYTLADSDSLARLARTAKQSFPWGLLIIQAIESCKYDMLHQLLTHPDVQVDDTHGLSATALFLAVERDSSFSVMTLYDHGASLTRNPSAGITILHMVNLVLCGPVSKSSCSCLPFLIRHVPLDVWISVYMEALISMDIASSLQVDSWTSMATKTGIREWFTIGMEKAQLSVWNQLSPYFPRVLCVVIFSYI